jgi:hypothetical protein
MAAPVKALTLSGHGLAAAVVVELLFTFALAYVVTTVTNGVRGVSIDRFGTTIGNSDKRVGPEIPVSASARDRVMQQFSDAKGSHVHRYAADYHHGSVTAGLLDYARLADAACPTLVLRLGSRSRSS